MKKGMKGSKCTGSLSVGFIEQINSLCKDVSKEMAHTDLSYSHLICAVEKPLISSILNVVGGNQTKAALLLGINRATLRAKIRKFGLIPKSL